MNRILTALIVLVAVAAGGVLSSNYYAQYLALAGVDAAFEHFRAGGGTASHGKVEFNPWTRTLIVNDIVLEPGQHSKAGFTIGGIKIAGFWAAGVSKTDDAHFSADSIGFVGSELTMQVEMGPAKVKATYNYKVPQLTVQGYSGPILGKGSPASDSLVDVYRYYLDQFADVTASSIVAPTTTVTVESGSNGPISGDFAHSGLAIQNIKQGHISTVKQDRAVFNLNVHEPGKQDKLTGEIANIIASDFDATALAAMLNPANANDDTFRRIYRRISGGPYTLTSAQGVRMQLDGFAIEDVEAQPSIVQSFLTFMTAAPHIQPASRSSTEQQKVLESVAEIYERIRVGKVDLGKLSVGTPQGEIKLSAVRYDQSELALEGFDATLPKGPVKVERFALKSFSPAKLIRSSVQFTVRGAPSEDALIGLFRVLEGVEIKGLVAPYKDPKKPITLDSFNLNWGQFVGPIPSKFGLVAGMVVPADSSDPKQAALIAAGIDKLALAVDFGAAWSEASHTIALAPASIDVGNVLKAQARVTLGNVQREAFSTDRSQAMAQIAQMEAGAVELTLHDAGGVDLIVAKFAQDHDMSRDAARSAIIDSIKAQRETAPNPDAAAAVDAIARFIETPGQTLIIKLAPLGEVRMDQLMNLLNSDPLVALSQFKIEASTGM